LEEFEGPLEEQDFWNQRKQREDWVRELGEKEWTLHTMLEAHDGLIDRRDRVRSAALGALMDLAEKDPDPVEVTPLALLRSYVGYFTAASGAAQVFYRFLLELGTDEADRILREILHNTDPMRNRDFEQLGRYLVESDADKYLQVLEDADLSTKKGKIFRRVKREAREET